MTWLHLLGVEFLRFVSGHAMLDASAQVLRSPFSTSTRPSGPASPIPSLKFSTNSYRRHSSISILALRDRLSSNVPSTNLTRTDSMTRRRISGLAQRIREPRALPPLVVTARRHEEPHPPILPSSHLEHLSASHSATSSAHASRIVSQMIRSEMTKGQSRNAFTVLKYYENSTTSRSRLPVTALIHGLLRSGLTLKAARVAEKAMQGRGTSRWWSPPIGQTPTVVQLSPRTLEAMMKALCATPPVTHTPLGSRMAKVGIWGRSASKPVNPREPMHGEAHSNPRLNKGTRQALLLMQVARHTRQRRTREMYSQLIDACLLQGEILTASLLFVLLVRDWQVRKVLETAIEDRRDDKPRPAPSSKTALMTPRRTLVLPAASITSLQPSPATPVVFRLDKLSAPSHPPPYPDPSFMRRIIRSLDYTAHPGDVDNPSSMYDPPPDYAHQSLGAIYHIAKLLEQRMIPFAQIAPLLEAMYCVPSKSWYQLKHKTREPTPIEVRTYTHGVLDSLVFSLPTKAASPKRPLPALDTRSYNSLTHYAFQYRGSPKMAEGIIRHMTSKREPTLKPNVVTYNILLRAATVLHQNEMASRLLKEFDLGPISRPTQTTLEGVRPAAATSNKSAPSEPSVVPTVRSHGKDHKTPQQSLVPVTRIVPDSYTLNAALTHLTASGSSETATQLAQQILEGKFPFAGSQQQTLGPFVFTPLVNALCKAGRVGLAEKVFRYAKRLEEESWSRTPNEVRPWCLPVEAYTCLMQCYADQAQKGHSRPTEGGVDDPSRPHHIVRGWGARTWCGTRRRPTSSQRRWELARAQAFDLYKSMMASNEHVSQSLMSVQWLLQHTQSTKTPRQLLRCSELFLDVSPPIPDARFYNAFLSVFERYEGRSVSAKADAKKWGRKLHSSSSAGCDVSRSSFEQRQREHALIQIGNDMLGLGLELPVGFKVILGYEVYQHAFCPSPLVDVKPPRHNPEATRFHPFRSPVINARGGSSRRRWRRGRRSSLQKQVESLSRHIVHPTSPITIN